MEARLRPLRCSVFAIAAGVLLGCHGSDRNGTADLRAANRVVAIQYGKLVDVYGLARGGDDTAIELFEVDVLVSPDVRDERDTGSAVPDESILYDFLAADPDTLQPRLLITRPVGSEAFQTAYDALDDKLSGVSPAAWTRQPAKVPIPVVPRNGGFRLTFEKPLDLPPDFFYERDASGRIIDVRNTTAVQLLRIVGDPTQGEPRDIFAPVPIRIVVRRNTLILDPVLLGSEGRSLKAPTAPTGLPESEDQSGANIRLALALADPLSLPGLAQDPITGVNLDGARSVIRDFRSGNRLDSTPTIARGFLRDPTPPRLIGAMSMLLENVEAVDLAGRRATEVTIFKDGVSHEIDRGDVVQFFTTSRGSPGVPAAVAEVLRDPQDDRGRPEVQHVRVLVRPLRGPSGGDVLEALDPSELPGYPPDPGPQRDLFLRLHAPRAVLMAEYTHLRPRPSPQGGYYGDDSRYFLSFDPGPVSQSGGALYREEVSPFADAILKFSKPIDLATLDTFDNVFFATRDVLTIKSSRKRAFDDIETFLANRGIDPATFDLEKFKTPHLITSRALDDTGLQTSIRLRTPLGFYLDEAMRIAAVEDENLPFSEQRYHYFLHLVGGAAGVKDLSGNAIDLGNATSSPSPTFLGMEFGLDTKAEDNIVAHVVRRFARADEDERPNYYRPDEIARTGLPIPALALPHLDVFGPVAHSEEGELLARSPGRVTKVVDHLNQIAPPSQSSVLRFCPETVGNEFQNARQTGANPSGQPEPEPFNPLGCRMQMLWREIDMSLSRTDPHDFNLDVEQMYWAPFRGSAVVFDEFDRVSLFLGHAESRPEPCASQSTTFPSLPNSGLFPTFATNYAHNIDTAGRIESQPPPHPAFVDRVLTIDPTHAVGEPHGVNLFFPLPEFDTTTRSGDTRDPLFVWRDESETVQGGTSSVAPARMNPYILSPFMAGLGQRIQDVGTQTCRVDGAWDNARNASLLTGQLTDVFTGGLVGTIGLPLLADFWVYPDSPQLPAGAPSRATGINGWQVSLTTSGYRSITPYFRVYSGGGRGASPTPMDPSRAGWYVASGGYTPSGARTTPRDNKVFWVMADFLKRTSVVTAGFVEIANPHRMLAGSDPRLGPYPTDGRLPEFVHGTRTSDGGLPAGTSIRTEFRGASVLDQQSVIWPRIEQMPSSCPSPTLIRPNLDNFPLDPLKAGDAGIRKFDDRDARNWWTHPYNRTVTDYVPEPGQLMDPDLTSTFAGPKETFLPADVKYINWRFIMRNNVDATPPSSPRLDAFYLCYRLQSR